MSIIKKESFMDKEKQKEVNELCNYIASCLMISRECSSNNVALAAYLLYKASLCNNPLNITISDFIYEKFEINNDAKYLIPNKISSEVWDRLVKIVPKYSSEIFALATISSMNEFEQRGSAMETPDSIIKLANKILNIQDREKVADICCGNGNFVVKAALNNQNASYCAYDINVESSMVASIRAELIDADINVKICDAFSLLRDERKMKFNKIFSNYPFGLKLKQLGEGSLYLDRLSEQYPGFSKATSSDWIFNSLLCELLSENGKAVSVMTNGSTWNIIDKPIRKHFVESGMVESVISLPGRMFSYAGIPTTLIVLSKGNKKVRMVDATELCQQGRRQNEFSDKDIDMIINALNQDSEYSKEVSIEELRKNDYNLSLSRYATDNISFENGVPFESIIKSITRGAPCTASQLDEMVSDSVTNMQYLMLANIQNGLIDDKLPYLSKIESKYEKYCLKNNNLILSKNGYPYKVAVASVKDGQQILANGNLFIIELDEEKANPYYIKAFLDSEQGIAVLKSITAGTAIPNIGIDALKKIEIPLPSLEEQERIAQKYQSTLDEIAIIKLRLEKAINKLHHIFDEEVE